MTDYDDEIAELLKDNFLLEDLAILLQSLNAQIEEVKAMAHEMDCDPNRIKTANGDLMMRSLIVGKAHCINAITQMKTMSHYAREINIYNATTAPVE